MKASIATLRAAHRASEAARDKLLAKHGDLNLTIDGLKDEFAGVERELLQALADKGVTSLQPDDYVKNTERKTIVEGQITDLERTTSKTEERRQSVATLSSTLNEAWLEEYRTTTEALEKIDQAQTELKITPTFKGGRQHSPPGWNRLSREAVCAQTPSRPSAPSMQTSPPFTPTLTMPPLWPAAARMHFGNTS